MSSTYRLLARFVVIMLLFGVLPAMQTQPAAAQDTASYTAIKYDCAPGYDPGSGDANAAFANCNSPAAGVSFTLQAGGGYGGGTQQTDGSGSTSWSGIPLGSGYSVSESVPQGYGTPWVYCEVSGDPNNPGDVQQSYFAANGGNMDVGYSDPSLASYTQATCYWFNATPADQQSLQGQQNGNQQIAGNAIVKVQKFLCEDQTYDYEAFTISDYRTYCPGFHNGVNFSIDGGTPAATGNGNGTVEFGALGPGQHDLRLHEAEGYRPQAVYCVEYQNGGSAPTVNETHKQTLTDEGNGTYRLSPTLQDGYTYNCAWYDYAEVHPNVHIYKYYCDPNFDWQGGGYDYLLSGCTNPQSGVYFEIQNGTYSEGRATGSNGQASWPDVPSGALQITEQVPSGYQVGRIFCGVAAQNNLTQPTTWDEYTYSEGWNVQLPEGQYLHCYVFDIPADYGTVYLYKLYCPPDFDWQGGGYDYLLSGCPTPQEDVYFEIHNGSYSQGGTTDTGGTATWTDVPTGTLEIVEQAPSGYTVGRVFCGYSPNGQDLPSSWDEYTYDQGIQVDVQSGEYLLCVFYDIPVVDEYGTVYLTKYYCAPEFDWQGGGFDYLLTGCQNPHAGVSFELTSSEGTSGGTTESNGRATWNDVPVGPVTITEQVPDGYQIGRIFCGVNEDTGSPTVPDEYTYNGGLEAQVPAGPSYLDCYIFNIPVVDEYGTVYLYKYYCAPEFDWQSNGYDYLLSGCTSPHDNVYFELYSGSYTEGQTTDTAGAATWSDVPWGGLSFYEEVPDGYQVGRIFCGYSDTDGTPPTSWDEYSYSGGWDVPTPPGKYLYCYVFDVPYEYGTIYFYKYYCAPDYDWQTGGYENILSGCNTPQPDVYFEIQNGSYTQGQTTDSSGYATWGDAPWGTLQIVEQEPDGYTVGRIFCGYSDQEGVAPTSWTEYSYSGGWNVDHNEGQYLYCYIFDVPYDYGTIYFYKYYCAPDFDWASNGYDYLLSGCTTPHENVYFEAYAGSYTQGQTTDTSGYATWTDVPWGNLSFYEEVPDGYQVGRIFCGYSEQEGIAPSSWDEYSYSDGWDVPAPPGKYLYCYIFDVPYDYGTVYIYKYYCEPDFDWGSNGYDYLLSGCTSAHENVYFEIHNGGYSEGQTTDSAGAASWSDVPSGALEIVETFPDGYQVGRIFCGVVAQNAGTLPTTWDEYDYQEGWFVDLPEGQYLHCYVFDVPYEYGTIYLYKYYCEPDFDWNGGGYDYLLSGCTTPHTGVPFEVDNLAYTQGQTTDSAGYATWEDVPPGNYRVIEDVPDGYMVGRIFCGYSDQEGNPPTSWDEYFYGDWYDIYVEGGQYLYCYVFDVPYEYGTVYLYKYYCDPEFDWQSNGYDYLYAECTSWQPNVYFEIESGGYVSGQSTDSSGTATWSDVPVGPIRIWEQPPDGYQVGRIFCGVVAQNDGTLPTSWEEYDYTDAWYVDLPEGQYLHCYVFDVPTEYGWVTVWKYTCPQDFDYASFELSYYESTCVERPAGVGFDLYNPPYGYEETQSTDSSGVASWSDVPSGGDLYFWEVPNGYTPIAVWCGVSSDGSEPTTWDEYSLDSDGSLSGLWVEPNQYLYCKWFNKPYDYPQVWFYKYNCDETAHWNWAYHQLLAQCTAPAPDVEFGWGAQGSGPSLSITDDQGKWLYEDLEPGIWYWEESYPSGYAGAVVYCQWVGAYGSGDYQKATLDGSTLWLDVDWGDVVTCYWFDFPTGHEPPASGGSGGSDSSGSSGGSDSSGGSSSAGGTAGSGGTGTAGGTGGTAGPGGPPLLSSNIPTSPPGGGPVGGSTSQPGDPSAPATLTIVKHTCAEGFDLYGDDADVEQDCTELTEGIDYSLTDLATADAEPVDQTTGGDGKATWTNLEAGPYLIVEALPEDTYSSFIWTCESDKREFQLEYPFTPFSYAGPNGEIGITLIAGEKLECDWYNVPSAPVEVTVLKFECPGSPVIIAQCSPAGAGIAFNLTPAGGAVGAIIQLTTDESGSATGSGAAGTYTVAEQGGSPCLIDSESLDEQGNVLLAAGEPAEIRVYNCGGGGG